MRDIQVLIIDPQNDFCNSKGALFVPGADEDAERLGAFLDRAVSKLSDIHVTLDSHRLFDIAHPIYWVNSQGLHPTPFTIITEDDVKNGVWTTTHPFLRQRAVEYVESLAKNSRYPLCIWPPHCQIGSWGHTIAAPVYEALLKWEATKLGLVDFVTKGSNPHTEHYSAVQADVPDPSDPTTMLNTPLIKILENADEVIVSGQALSHCVAETVRDIVDGFGTDAVKKMVLLDDTCSNVPTFESLGDAFLRDMVAKGMRTAKSTDYLV